MTVKESAENYEICKHIIATARKINKMGYGHIKFKPVPWHNEEKNGKYTVMK